MLTHVDWGARGNVGYLKKRWVAGLTGAGGSALDADEHVDAEGDHHEPKASAFGLFSVEATSGFTRVAAR